MKRGLVSITLLLFGLFAGSVTNAQGIVAAPTPVRVSSETRELLGLKLRPEIAAIVDEIEARTRKTIRAEFYEQPEYQLGASFIEDESGRAIVIVEPSLEDDPKKLEAVLTHELLHLRLTVNGYPSFVWAPTVRTAKGMAIDVEQSNINDLRSIIEHRVFRAEMLKFDLYRYIDLAGDTLAVARKRKGDEAGQDDVINYVRAILEYQDPKDVAAVRQAYIANGWGSSVRDGTAIAAIIDGSAITSPKDIEYVFLKCVARLYPPPSAAFRFSLKIDPTNKYFRRMTLNIGRVPKRRK